MPADLTVVSVKLPPLRSPCPIVVLVEIENTGTDPADPAPYDVTIDIGTGDIPDAHFEAIVTTAEDQRLAPGRIIVIPVEVRLPCTSPISLRATVDKRQQIANNLRSAPYRTYTGLVPIPVPWLVATLRIGVRDATTGIVTFDPNALCPGKAVVAEVLVTNQGCIASKPSKTEVVLEDPNAVPFPVPLGTYPYMVPALSPGSSHATSLSFAAPGSTKGFSGVLAVRVSVDANANPDQCDRTQLQASIVKPFVASGPPQLSLTVGAAGNIRPGQVPALTWEILNGCTEIGTADIKIQFGTPAIELFRTQLPIPLQTSVTGGLGPGNLTIPMTIASAFWTVGLKTLELEVTGNGSAGGPYRTTAYLNVVPEPIDETWWVWVGVPAGAWKSPYVVAGAFNNSGAASMRVTAVSAVEHPTDVTGTAEDQTITPGNMPVIAATAVMPAGSEVIGWTRVPSWPWLTKGTPVEVGPRSRTFSYTATFSLTDAFGNMYPTIVSSSALVTVSVPPTKIGALGLASAFLTSGGIFLGLAAFVLVTIPYPGNAIFAVALAAVAMALIIAATLLLYDAYDPPVPDFREREPVLADPRAWTIPEADDESLHPLRTLALLLGRAVSARIRAVRYRDRTWSAYLDRSESTRVRYREEARDELETLRRLVPAAMDAAGEAHDSVEQLFRASHDWLIPDNLGEMVDRFADELHLSDYERALVVERVKMLDVEELRRSVGDARSYGIGAVCDAIRELYETTASEFAEREYLR